MDILSQDLLYYDILSSRHKKRFEGEFYQSRSVYEELLALAKRYGQESSLNLIR